jgi:phytoene dehydrogenase-like protein
VDGYAPGFAASVIGRLSLSPLDLERRFGPKMDARTRNAKLRGWHDAVRRTLG